MEVWILLAAAGSGYLAKRWQNSQKPKGAVADEIEDDNNATYVAHSRGRYRRFSSSGRRPTAGKSLCGKGAPHWAKQPQKSGGNLNRVAGGDGGMKVSNEGHVCDNDDDDCQICIATRDPNGYPTLSKRGLEEGNLSDYLSRMCLSDGYEKRAQGVEQNKLELQKIDVMRATEESNTFSRPWSGKRASESLDDKVLKGRQNFQDGYAGKRMKDAFETSEGGSVFDSWMPGFWDVSKGVFVLDTASLLVQHHGARSTGSSSSRKSRTPIKHGRGKSIRKKNLNGLKPMSSLESCLSAQLHEDYARRKTPGGHRGVANNLADKISSKVESVANDGNSGAIKAEFAIGLPSLPRQSSSRISSTFTSWGDAYNPFAGTSCSKLTRGMARMDEGTSHTKGRAGSSLEGLLFNFGVGVGMMFTVMSNMHEVRRLTSLLKETESLIRDLEDELETNEGVVSDSDVFIKKSAGMRFAMEQRRNRFSNTLRKVKSATESLSSTRAHSSDGSVKAGQHAHSKDMSKLEAELEAELERMELSLGEGDPQKLHVKSSGSCELNGDVGRLVQGELTSLGLPHEVEVESEDVDDSSSSSQGDLHVRNYLVSPRALTKRLHEVLEARQEQQISEFEDELAVLRSKLHEREEEIVRLKRRSMGVLPALGNEDRVHHSSLNYTLNKGASALEGHSSVERRGTSSQIRHSLNVSPASPPHILPTYGPSSGIESWSRKGDLEDKSTAYITLGGEAWAAYKEACDEFSKLSGDFSQNTERHDGFAKDSRVVGNSDGLEQVDLLSLAQDFYGTGDPELFANMPAYTGGLGKGRHYSRRKSCKGPHPEPEHAISSSRGFDSSDDATNDTSVSTPCSVKFMDVRIVGSFEDSREGKEEEGYGMSIPPYRDWSQEILVRAGVNTPNQEEMCSSTHPIVEDSSMAHPPMHKGDWAGPDDTDYYSELDEQLGHLLIKRIVEKSRKGSPIVQDAHTALASLEKGDRLQAADEGGEGKW